jgi:hypothetical protein
MAVGLARQVKSRYEAQETVEQIQQMRRYGWRAGRGVMGIPFMLVGAFRSQGPLRWVFIGLAVGFTALELWLWWRRPPD